MMLIVGLVGVGILSVLVSVLILDFVEERRSRREERRRKREAGE